MNAAPILSVVGGRTTEALFAVPPVPVVVKIAGRRFEIGAWYALHPNPWDDGDVHRLLEIVYWRRGWHVVTRASRRIKTTRWDLDAWSQVAGNEVPAP